MVSVKNKPVKVTDEIQLATKFAKKSPTKCLPVDNLIDGISLEAWNSWDASMDIGMLVDDDLFMDTNRENAICP